jgi:GTP pyrophosphokinase
LKEKKFEELEDRLAIRIIVENEKDCYQALRIVHAHMQPIQEKLKDYIGRPKENEYQSIHTTVYPLRNISEQPIEIQIRTQKMHTICEYGPAAHGKYKIGVYSLETPKSRINLLKNLKNLQITAMSPMQLEKALEKNFNNKEMTIFDSESNPHHLRKPANALDFLTKKYEKKIAKLKEIRVNGRIAPPETPLKNGDIIEGKFSRHRSLKRSWLNACEHKETVAQIEKML